LNQNKYNDQIIAIKIPHEYKNKIKAQLFFFAGLTNSKIFKGLESLAYNNKDKLYYELLNPVKD